MQSSTIVRRFVSSIKAQGEAAAKQRQEEALVPDVEFSEVHDVLDHTDVDVQRCAINKRTLTCGEARAVYLNEDDGLLGIVYPVSGRKESPDRITRYWSVIAVQYVDQPPNSGLFPSLHSAVSWLCFANISKLNTSDRKAAISLVHNLELAHDLETA